MGELTATTRRARNGKVKGVTKSHPSLSPLHLFAILLLAAAMQSPHPFAEAAEFAAKIALSYSTTVHCHPSDRNICVGYMTSYGPFPLSICDDEGFNCDMMYDDMLGGYGWNYVFVRGLRQNDPLPSSDLDEYKTGLVVDVRLENDGLTCEVAVGSTTCQSCVPCSVAAVSADCTNLPEGRNIECEALGPVFYPLILPNGAIPPPAVTIGAADDVPTETTKTVAQPNEALPAATEDTAAIVSSKIVEEQSGEVSAAPLRMLFASSLLGIALATIATC